MRTASDARRRRTIGALLGLGLFAFYVTIARGEFVSADGVFMASVGRGIWENGSIQTFGDSFGADLGGGPHYTSYGVGMSALMAPLWGLHNAIGDYDPVLPLLVNAVLLALAAAVLYAIGLELAWRTATALVVALAFGLLTMAPNYSTDLFNEPMITLGTLAVIYGLLSWRRGTRAGPWVCGIAVGACLPFRTDALLLVGGALLAIPLFVYMRILRATWRSWLPALAIPIAAGALWVGHHNNLRYGSPFESGYDTMGFPVSFAHGLFVQIVSPGKGFFWYNPLLLLGLVGMWWLARYQRALAITIAALIVVRVAWYANWFDPEGGIAWGPRFLLPCCGLLLIPVGEMWERSGAWRPAARAVLASSALVLTLVSIPVVATSVWVPYELYRLQIRETALSFTDPDEAFVVERTEWHRTYYSWSATPLARHARAVNDAPFIAPRWWRGGPSLQGVTTLVAAFGLLGTALVLARRRDARSAEGPVTAIAGLGEGVGAKSGETLRLEEFVDLRGGDGVVTEGV